MILYELNKKLNNARQRGFIINEINELTIKMYSSLSIINIRCFSKFPIPMCQKFF